MLVVSVAPADVDEARRRHALLADRAAIVEVAGTRHAARQPPTSHVELETARTTRLDVGVRDEQAVEVDVAGATHDEYERVVPAARGTNLGCARRRQRQAVALETVEPQRRRAGEGDRLERRHRDRRLRRFGIAAETAEPRLALVSERQSIAAALDAHSVEELRGHVDGDSPRSATLDDHFPLAVDGNGG